MRKTQKEIARKVGVSVMTISLALRDSPLLREETRRKVQQAADEMNYYPSEIARSLSTGKSRTVGFVMPEFSQNFFFEFLEEINLRLDRKRYLVIPISVKNNEGRYVRNAIETFISRGVDGIIAPHVPARIAAHLKEKNIPFVLYGNTGGFVPAAAGKKSNGFDYVMCDKYKGARMMMEHLVNLGYRKIDFLCQTGDEARFAAYRDVLAESGIPYREEMVFHGAGFYETGHAGMKKLLSGGERPDAVFAMNDLSAIGSMRAISEAGLRVPGDIAVAGFDNIKEGKYSAVSLTTVDQKREILAGHITEILLRKIEKGDRRRYRVVVEPDLVIRESCGYKLRKENQNPSHGEHIKEEFGVKEVVAGI